MDPQSQVVGEDTEQDDSKTKNRHDDDDDDDDTCAAVILKPIRQAISRQQQLEALKSLDLNDDFLLKNNNNNNNNNTEKHDRNNTETERNNNVIRLQVALGLIQTIPVVGNDMQEALLNALERISGGDSGASLILTAVLQTLRDIAASSSSLSFPLSSSSSSSSPSCLVGTSSTSTINNNNKSSGLQGGKQESTMMMTSTSLSTALAALYRIACTFPNNQENHRHHHHDNIDGKQQPPRQTSLWNITVFDANINKEEHIMDHHHSSSSLWIMMIGQLLLVPQLAANAAAAAAHAHFVVGTSSNNSLLMTTTGCGSQQLSLSLLLPHWLTPPSRYYCLLVECACRHYYYCENLNQQQKPGLLPVLIQHMMRRGHVHYVARGFYHFLRRQKHHHPKGGGGGEQEEANKDKDDPNVVITLMSDNPIMKNKARMLGALLVADDGNNNNDDGSCNDAKKKKISSVSSSSSSLLLLLSPREVALLYHALLKLALTRELQSTTSSTTNGNDSHDDDDYFKNDDLTMAAVETIFRPALERGGIDVQDAVVRQVVLSSSCSSSSSLCRQQDTMDYYHPKRVGDQVVSLLMSLSNNDIKDSDNDDDDDDDDPSLLFEKTTIIPHQALVRQLNEVSLDWSQPAAFVQNTDPRRQHYVSCFLCSALEALQKNETARTQQSDRENVVDWESQDFLSTILQGVTTRLESSHNDSIRRDGMRVGEALARLLGQELKFDELNDERTTSPHMAANSTNTTVKEHGQKHLDNGKGKDQDHEQQQQHDPKSANARQQKHIHTEASSQSTKIMKRRQRARQARLMDPDAAYVSSEDEQDVESDDEEESETSEASSLEDSVWSDNENDELLPYDLQDDQEDLLETPKPLYLKDCLDLLQTPETNEHAASRHEMALQTLASLVRSSPMDIVDIAPSLALQVLRMENKYVLENFDENIAFSLTALLVHQPQSVGQALITTFFKGDVCLMDRLKIFTALNQSAYELSGIKDFEQGHLQQQQQRGRTIQQPRVSGKRNLVSSAASMGTDGDTTLSTAVENVLGTTGETSVTRRWGKSRQQRFMVNNKFNRIGPMWFVMLIQGFLECKEDAKIWGGANGATLLARFFLTLATLTEFCGLGTEFHSPGNTSIACHLLNLVCGFLHADVAQVRTAALCAVSTSLALMRSDQLLRLLYSSAQNDDHADNNNLPIMLQRIAQADPDVDCRRLAQTISGQMVRALQDSSMSSSLSYY